MSLMVESEIHNFDSFGVGFPSTLSAAINTHFSVYSTPGELVQVGLGPVSLGR